MTVFSRSLIDSMVSSLQSPDSGKKANRFDPIALVEEIRKKSLVVLTDRRGSYEATDLSPGEYKVMVEAQDHLSATGREVVIAPGEKRGEDFKLARSLAISGRVIDASGAAIPGSLITALPSSFASSDRVARAEIAASRTQRGDFSFVGSSARTLEDGSFSLGSLGPGLYEVSALAAGLVPAQVLDVPGGAKDLILKLGSGSKVTGNIAFRTDLSVEGAQVTLIPTEAMREMAEGPFVLESTFHVELLDGSRRSARLQMPGPFEVTGVPPGRYKLQAVAIGHRPVVLPWLRIGPGESVDVGQLRLEPDKPLMGRVVDRRSTPIEGAKVLVHEKGRGKDVIAGIEAPSIEESLTDSRGNFAVGNVPWSAYDLAIFSDRHRAALREGVDAGTAGLEIVLEDGFTLHGKVIDAEDGSPVAGAEVTHRFQQRTVTDEEGRFHLSGLGPPEAAGSAERAFQAGLIVTAPGYRRWGKLVNVFTRSESSELEIQLRRGPVLHGIVLDEDGKPVPGASVRIVTPGVPIRRMLRSVPMPTSTGEDGTFTIGMESLDVGGDPVKPRLEAYHSSLGRAISGPIEGPGEGKELPSFELVLAKGARISGRVVDGRGMAVSQATVSLTPLGPISNTSQVADAMGVSEAQDWTSVDPKGRFSFQGVGSGEYRIDVERAGFAPTRRRITVSGEDLVLELAIQDGTFLGGKVVNQGGRPLAGVLVVAARIDPDSSLGRSMVDLPRVLARTGGIRRCLTGEDGNYLLEDLPEERLCLAARAPGYELGTLIDPELGRDDNDMTLEALGSVSVLAVDAETRQPLLEYSANLRHEGRADGGGVPPEVAAKMHPWNLSRTGMRTFRSGERAIYEDVPPGRLGLTVEAPGYLPSREKVTLQPGNSVETRVALRAGHRVIGVVVASPDETPVQGALVSLNPLRPSARSPLSAPSPVRTGNDGTFEIRGVAEGTYQAQVRHDEFQPATSAEFTVNGEASVGKVVLNSAGIVSIDIENLPQEVTGQGPSPSVALEPVGGGATSLSCFRNRGSTFCARSVPPGEYVVRIQVRGHRPFRYGTVTVGEGEQKLRLRYLGVGE